MEEAKFEDALPDPEFLIKSIAEQGYSLETALADLIDNSIAASADKIEILIDTTTEPFTLFLADNGNGMDETDLKQSMKFPSSSPEATRKPNDLGRFGLGLKTASFSQTRHLTVISRKQGQDKFKGRTWNVNALKDKRWKILVEQDSGIKKTIDQYTSLSSGYLNGFETFTPNTVVVWKGLYKFEDYLTESDKSKELKKQITEVTSQYLSLVFHRFMERKSGPIKIRINNTQLISFNPFPSDQTDVRKLDSNKRQFQTDTLKIEGFILPARSLDESKNDGSIWTQPGRSLTDMEGMYIYRGDRIILHGGWNGIVKKNPRLQLARLKVDIGNSIDNYFHLNVAKSSIVVPPDLRIAFIRYVNDLRHEAEKEYFNKGLKTISVMKNSKEGSLFVRIASNRGMILKINDDFPILKNLMSQLSFDQKKVFSLVFKLVETTLNKARQVHEDVGMNQILEDQELDLKTILDAIGELKRHGISSKDIKDNFLSSLGVKSDSIPDQIIKALSK